MVNYLGLACLLRKQNEKYETLKLQPRVDTSVLDLLFIDFHFQLLSGFNNSIQVQMEFLLPITILFQKYL